MRRTRFVLVCAMAILSACKGIETDVNPDAQGEIMISLSAEADAVPVAKSATECEVPDVNDFDVEIYKKVGGSQFIRLYRDTYAGFVGKRIPLNVGDYRLLAQHGDSAGVGFNATWFAADQEFTVNPQANETIDAVARMSKVKVAVNYGYNIQNDYSEGYYVKVRGENGLELRFESDESRAGYFPAGELVVEVYAVIDGVWKYHTAVEEVYRPNDFVTFNIDTKPGIGQATVNVVIVRGEEVIERNLEVISSDMLAKDLPTVDFKGFDSSMSTEAMEAVAHPERTRVDIVADGKVAGCFLKINSSYLAGCGLPVGEIDLASADESTAAGFREKGITWLRNMKGERLSFIDFSGYVDNIVNLHCDPDVLKDLSFELRILDNVGQEVSYGPYYIKENAPVFSFEAYDWNYYARRIDHLTASFSEGNPEKFEVQYYDGSEWVSAEKAGSDGKNFTYKPVTGLTPSKEYPVRAIYNGNEKMAKEYRFSTEAAAQVGNAGFEEWTTETFNYKVTLQGNRNIDWYLPWNDSQNQDHWWAVNSKKTMRSECSGTAFGIGNNFNFKVFPTISYFDGNSRSVQLATITTGKSATNTGPGTVDVVTAAGEMWIGTSNDSGDHLIDGHTFSSRPSKMSFSYQYSPVDNEKFYVYVELKDKDGNIIFSDEIKDGNEATEWNIMTIPFIYNDITKKITSIYVCFKSSSESSPGHEVDRTITMPNGNVKAIVGSILRIDDIELIYE